MTSGFIKIYRQMTKWEWYTDIPVKVLFLHLLLTAQHKPFRFKGEEYAAGSLVTGRQKLSKETTLTEMQVRTALTKLKSTNEITIKTNRHYSIISIKNWGRFQTDNQQNNQPITNKQPTNNQPITTIQEYKNERSKEYKNLEINGYIREKKNKKNDPFINPIIGLFKDEYFKIFNNRPYLTAIERNKIIELNSDIEDFGATLSVVLRKLKNIDFGFENWKPTASWLLKDSNYTAVLNGAYDRQIKQDPMGDFYKKEKERLAAKGIY